MQDTYYFGAGPATLPRAVLDNIKQELVDYRGSGISILELSHRSDDFIEILDQAENLLRELMDIPEDYAVLLLHGGATAQYSMLPLNFLHHGESADYVCTGHWSNKACKEAKKFADINEIQALVESETVSVKPMLQWGVSSKSKYVHYCDNETINGVVADIASMDSMKSKNVNLFCDMTSSILTRPIRVNDFGLIYASAQKNLGVAGLCVMVVKKDLLGNVCENIPSVFDYKNCFVNKSLVNTPPTFAIYVLCLMLNWLKAEGGAVEMNKRGQQQAKVLYDVVDASELYINKVDAKYRSSVNIPFFIKDKDLLDKFLMQADNNKLLGLRGHKSVGGVRVSLYNAMPQEGIQNLLDFMQNFEAANN